MRQRGDKPRPDAKNEAQQRDAESETDPALREDGAIQSVFGDVRGKLLDRVGISPFSLACLFAHHLHVCVKF